MHDEKVDHLYVGLFNQTFDFPFKIFPCESALKASVISRGAPFLGPILYIIMSW